jgi:hemerythrin-like domain-containing protein
MAASNDAAFDRISLWHAEHLNFVTLLDLFEGELDRFSRGKAPDYELMLDIMFYMTHYPDVLHHPKEDLAFARIAARSPAVRPLVEALHREHALLKREGDALVIALDDIVNGAITSRHHVEAPARAYIATFRRHMDAEEANILPVAAGLLDRDDWAAIDGALQKLDDPLFGKPRDERYAALRRRIARDSKPGAGRR